MSVDIQKTVLVVCSIAMLSVLSFDTPDKQTGKQLYEKHCIKCHGEDGGRGKFKAKDLRYSRVADTAILTLLKTGKKAMPSYTKRMTQEEMLSVIRYSKSLRK